MGTSRSGRIAQIGGAIALVVTALGGSKILDRCTTEKPATAEQQDATLQRITEVEKTNARIEQKLDATISKGVRRDNLQAEWACKMNGSKPTPIARGAPCYELVWEPPPLGASGPWVAREEWPEEPSR